MPGDRTTVYWDACVILAWLKDENRPNGEMNGVTDVATKIHSGDYILIASTILKTEILDSSLTSEQAEKLVNFLKRDNVALLNVDDRIATLASDLRDYYKKQKDIDHKPMLATPDALHLATAIHYGVNEFHTFDRLDKPNGRALLPLNGDVAGHRLTIIKPSIPQQMLRLQFRPKSLN